jgi:hypothetical protein
LKPFSWGDLDPSEVWPYVDPNDEREDEGEPAELPPVLDDDSPSKGTSGGPFGIFNPDGSRAVPAARRLARLPSCSSASSRKLMVYRFHWS